VTTQLQLVVVVLTISYLSVTLNQADLL
jgi:hypothetical protein